MSEPAQLRNLAPDLWDVEVHQQKGLHLRNRMVIARLPSGGLWLHSPVPLHDKLARDVEALGTIEHLVAPNKWHHQYLRAAKERWPQAKVWGAPGLQEKVKRLPIDQELDDSAEPWGETIHSALIRGFPKVEETVFLHRPSRTLICCDSLFNVQEEHHWLTRSFYKFSRIFRRVAMNERFWKGWRKDATAAQTSVRRILDWDFDRITMAHGEVIETSGHPQMENAMQWLLYP